MVSPCINTLQLIYHFTMGKCLNSVQIVNAMNTTAVRRVLPMSLGEHMHTFHLGPDLRVEWLGHGFVSSALLDTPNTFPEDCSNLHSYQH